MSGQNRWAIISTPEGFVLCNKENDYWVDREGNDYDQDQVVAEYSNFVFCKQQMTRAMALEIQLRPFWQASIEHELKVRNMMLDAVCAIAKDNEIK